MTKWLGVALKIRREQFTHFIVFFKNQTQTTKSKVRQYNSIYLFLCCLTVR